MPDKEKPIIRIITTVELYRNIDASKLLEWMSGVCEHCLIYFERVEEDTVKAVVLKIRLATPDIKIHKEFLLFLEEFDNCIIEIVRSKVPMDD